MSFLRFSLLLLLTIPFSSKAQPDTVSLDNFHLSLKKADKLEKLGVVVWDQREQIVDGTEKSSFLGYAKTVGAFNSDPVTIKEKVSLAEWLSERVTQAYDNNGLATVVVGVTANETSRAEIESKMKSSNVDRILVLQIKKLQFDAILELSYRAKLDVEVYSKDVELLSSIHVSEEREMEPVDDWKKKFPLQLVSIVEDALNNPQIFEALNE